MLSPKPAKVFSAMDAVKLAPEFWPTTTRGARVQDSLGVPAVKLQTVLKMPATSLPRPATWSIRLSPVSTRIELDGWGELGGIPYGVLVRTSWAKGGDPLATLRTR